MKQILQWRKTLRSSGYITDNGIHKSIEGEELDNELVHFDEKCKENRKWSKYHDIKSKNKKEIAEDIERIIGSIKEYGTADVADNLNETWQKCKKGKKADYLDFYKEVTQALEEVTAIDEENESAGNLETEDEVAQEEEEVEV